MAFWKLVPVCGLLLCAPLALGQSAQTSSASDSATPEVAAGEEEQFSFHGQFTNVTQFHPSFRSRYRGPNSLDPGNRGNEALNLTLYAGVQLWEGSEFWVNPEVDQGFGLSDTTGVAGYVNGQSAKVGAADPYVRLHRVFLRQTFGLGGDIEKVEPDLNQLGGTRRADNVVLTIGKFSVTDMFDNNSYAHDPLADFLNWSVIDAGAFDYAADAWGYSYGAAAEWTQSWWTLRGGAFDLSREPNGKQLQRDFHQFSLIAEVEGRYELFDQPGKLRLLAYLNRGRMANYLDAVRAAQVTGGVPDVNAVRRYAGRPGFVVNLEQQLTDGLGLFARGSINDGRKEAYEFTEINRSVSLGLSLKGDRWGRPDDTVAVAGVVNGLSSPAVDYFRDGGIGILIGDGRLDHYGLEKIIETYYNARVIDGVAISVDYQYISNPAYNADRGPVSVLGFRFHTEF